MLLYQNRFSMRSTVRRILCEKYKVQMVFKCRFSMRSINGLWEVQSTNGCREPRKAAPSPAPTTQQRRRAYPVWKTIHSSQIKIQNTKCQQYIHKISPQTNILPRRKISPTYLQKILSIPLGPTHKFPFQACRNCQCTIHSNLWELQLSHGSCADVTSVIKLKCKKINQDCQTPCLKLSRQGWSQPILEH